MEKPVRMHVTYRPKKGKEQELLGLVKKHGPALRSIGLLAADSSVTLYQATNKRSGETFFVEMFSWRDDKAAGIAHQTPEVMAVWEPMTPILEQLELAVIEEVRGT